MTRHFPSWRPRIVTGPTPEEKLAGIRKCLETGDSVQACQIYQEWQGVDLATAKIALQKLQSEFEAANPPSLLQRAWRKGWIGLVIAAGFAAWIFTR